MEYNISLWNDCDLNPNQFKKQIESFEDNSTVNFFAAEEYEIKLDNGQRGWEIINNLKTNINWNFVFGSADVNFYHKKYQDINKTSYLWPTFFINRSAFYLKDLDITIKDNIKYLFISMINLPRYHRCVLMDEIFKNKLNINAALTWHQPNTDYNWKSWNPEKLLLSDPEYRFYSADNQKNNALVPSIHKLPLEYFQSLFSLVSESSVDRLFLTEKTAIPLLTGQPFIVQGAPGFHSYLRDLGFELYTELFDYSFDKFIDYEKRTAAIIENINFLKDKNCIDLYKSVCDKTLRNRNLAISMANNSKMIPKIILTNNYAKKIYYKELYFLQNNR